MEPHYGEKIRMCVLFFSSKVDLLVIIFFEIFFSLRYAYLACQQLLFEFLFRGKFSILTLQSMTLSFGKHPEFLLRVGGHIKKE